MKPVAISETCVLEGTGLLFQEHEILPLSSQPRQQRTAASNSSSLQRREEREGTCSFPERGSVYEGTRTRANCETGAYTTQEALAPLDYELALRHLATDLGTGPLPVDIPSLREVVLGKRASEGASATNCESLDTTRMSTALDPPAFLVSGPYASLAESLRSLERCVQQIQDKLGFSIDERPESVERRVQETASFLRLKAMMSSSLSIQTDSLPGRAARLMHELQYWSVIRQHLAKVMMRAAQQRSSTTQPAEAVREADLDAFCERLAAYVKKRKNAEELWNRVCHGLKRISTLYPLMENQILTSRAQEIIQTEQSEETQSDLNEMLSRLQEMRDSLVKDDATVRSSAAFFHKRWEALEKRSNDKKR